MISVILRGTVPGLGKRGEVVNVSDGYARNYLLPNGLAMRSHPGAEAQAATMRKSREVRDAKERGAAEEVARKIAPVVVKVDARAGSEGRLFGSITAADIAEAVFAQTGFELDRRVIDVSDPIKTVGQHSVPARLHSDVQIFLQIEVTAR